MESRIKEMAYLVRSSKRHLQRTGVRHPDTVPYYRPWGFAIYRTYYGPDSDKHWSTLLDSLKRQTRLAFGVYEDLQGTDQDEVQRLKELFYLDPHDDALLLDGLDIAAIRTFCQGKERDETRVMAEDYFRHILLADEAVLKDIAGGESIVKAVSLGWEEGFSGWGWMRIPTGYLLELWQQLTMWDHRPERALSFSGQEKDLDDYVWPGDLALDASGSCSEIRRTIYKYSGQSLDFSDDE